MTRHNQVFSMLDNFQASARHWWALGSRLWTVGTWRWSADLRAPSQHRSASDLEGFCLRVGVKAGLYPLAEANYKQSRKSQVTREVQVKSQVVIFRVHFESFASMFSTLIGSHCKKKKKVLFWCLCFGYFQFALLNAAARSGQTK